MRETARIPRVPRIHILPDRLISQIAAGEVVERPASVVKELLENALDAGASALRVELESGGRRRIVVSDDGSGMGRDDSLLAFDRHATSKIATFDDLERVETLGFRGEALASIAAVAKVELLTAEAPGEGWRVRIEGGRVLHAEPAAAPRGTRLEVASLFFNVPARRAFLKSPETELRRCVEVVQGYALARPEVSFHVAHDGRELLEAPAAADAASGLRGRVAQIFGAELARRLTEIGPAGEAEAGGLVGSRLTTRGRRQFVFVNGRLIRDRAVMATFYRAVREEWASEEFPALFLFLTLPAAEVDVNVHPQKSEVRFRDAALLDRLHAALRAALARARGEEPAPWRTPDPGGRPAGALAWSGAGGRPWTAASEVREPARLAEAVYAPLERSPLPGPLAGRGAGPSRFRLLGQYKGTLLLLEGPDGLYLIDQHVAHERILYERLRRSLEARDHPSQPLLVPRLLALGPAERLRLLELRDELAGFGFSLEALSGSSVALRAAPAAISADEAEALLLQLAAHGGGGAAELHRRLLDALAASQACQAAIKMHHPLGPEAMEALVGELFAAEQPFACPHGRPTVLQMTDADLERRFGRRG
jgi:DNA mismatch repair protein MutL